MTPSSTSDIQKVGTDIVDTSVRPGWINNFTEFLDIYRKQLSPEEISTLLEYFNIILILSDSISRIEDPESQYLHFYLLWALKEAYVKAIGIGIGIDLTKVFFLYSCLNH